MKTKTELLLQTHQNRDYNLNDILHAMALYSMQQSCKEGELAQAFKAGEIYAYDKERGLEPVDFEEWYKGFSNEK